MTEQEELERIEWLENTVDRFSRWATSTYDRYMELKNEEDIVRLQWLHERLDALNAELDVLTYS